MIAQCLIALGGNVGDVPATFARALQELRGLPGVIEITGVSRWHRTVPVGEQAGEMYWDGAATLTTQLSPLALLDVLQDVERQQGRVRTVHWGPRTLDLDLILYGGEIVREPRLIVPHPACWYRRFVLDPAVEVAANWWHPERNMTLEHLRDRLLVRPLPIALAGGTALDRQQLCAELSQREPLVHWLDWNKARAESFGVGSGPQQQPTQSLPEIPLVIWWESGSAVPFASLPSSSRLALPAGTQKIVTSLLDTARAALGE